MRLLLINPAERRVLRSNLPARIEQFRGKNPPIGLVCLAAAAREVDGWDAALLDANALDLTPEAVVREVAARQPDLVGVTATTFTLLDALDCARAAKAGHPATQVVVGGVHPFAYPAETLRQPEVDWIVAGEADLVFPEFLRRWRDHGPASALDEPLPGVAGKHAPLDGFVPAPPVLELDRLPLPAWDLTPLDRYASLVNAARPATILITSRGCPFRCRYCALSPTGKKWRAHGPARVVQEMKAARGLGARYLMLYDETFTVDRRRVLAICEALQRERVDVPWMARATPDTVDGEMLAAMKRAGCDMVTFGVEAGTPEALRRLGRKPTVEEAIAAFRAAHEAGLRTIAYFMIGNPGETRKEIGQSLQLARRLNPDFVHASIYMPYPSSALYEEGLQRGAIARDYWRDFAARPGDGFVPPYGSESLRDAELEALLVWFYRAFFLHPGRIWRQLRRLRSAADLWTAIKAATMLLRPAVGGRV